jgi:hypothetical protein
MGAIPGVGIQNPQAEHIAEKVSEGSVFVAQSLLAVWFLRHLAKAHSQKWLCYLFFPQPVKPARLIMGC